MKEQLAFNGMGVSLDEKIVEAVALLRTNEPPEGYYIAFSGGKDSVVIKHLAERAGVKFTANYNDTTIDPPELQRFIRKVHADVLIHRPPRSFFQMVERKGLPTRIGRWCCEEFKESKGEGVLVFGVRAAESFKRAKMWREVTPWRGGGTVEKTAVCPIVYWTDDDVWLYIRREGIPYCSLYDEGWKRLGCIGCPMAGAKRRDEFTRWPKYEAAWRRATNRYYEGYVDRATRSGNVRCTSRFRSGSEMFEWWMSDHPTSADMDGECLGLFDAVDTEEADR